MGLFYKRGCQVKTLSPSQGGFVFLGIQPLLATLTLLRIALWASPRISGSHLAFVRSALAPISSSVATWPVGSEEARGCASLRPPLKLYVPVSGIQLSRRRS